MSTGKVPSQDMLKSPKGDGIFCPLFPYKNQQKLENFIKFYKFGNAVDQKLDQLNNFALKP
jgi:hypothetical protein